MPTARQMTFRLDISKRCDLKQQPPFGIRHIACFLISLPILQWVCVSRQSVLGNKPVISLAVLLKYHYISLSVLKLALLLRTTQ